MLDSSQFYSYVLGGKAQPVSACSDGGRKRPDYSSFTRHPPPAPTGTHPSSPTSTAPSPSPSPNCIFSPTSVSCRSPAFRRHPRPLFSPPARASATVVSRRESVGFERPLATVRALALPDLQARAQLRSQVKVRVHGYWTKTRPHASHPSPRSQTLNTHTADFQARSAKRLCIQTLALRLPLHGTRFPIASSGHASIKAVSLAVF